MNMPREVVIKGAGDLASGVAYRLWQAGFDVVMLELPQPLVVRRTVAFAGAVYEGSVTVEGVTAELCHSAAGAPGLLQKRKIPVLVDPHGESIPLLQPGILIDAVMAKKNTGTAIGDALLVIGLGPGFTAGVDVHAVIETKRGHNLGKVIYAGAAEANTGVPGEIAGVSRERLLRAPADGIFKPLKEIGDMVAPGEAAAMVDHLPVKAGTGGLVRGMLYPGLAVKAGMKVGDIDPRGAAVDYKTVSDKARAVGGGVLEAILNRFLRDC